VARKGDYDYQNLFASLPLHPNVTALTANDDESDLAKNSYDFATRDYGKPAQTRPTFATVTRGR